MEDKFARYTKNRSDLSDNAPHVPWGRVIMRVISTVRFLPKLRIYSGNAILSDGALHRITTSWVRDNNADQGVTRRGIRYHNVY